MNSLVIYKCSKLLNDIKILKCNNCKCLKCSLTRLIQAETFKCPCCNLTLNETISNDYHNEFNKYKREIDDLVERKIDGINEIIIHCDSVRTQVRQHFDIKIVELMAKTRDLFLKQIDSYEIDFIQQYSNNATKLFEQFLDIYNQNDNLKDKDKIKTIINFRIRKLLSTKLKKEKNIFLEFLPNQTNESSSSMCLQLIGNLSNYKKLDIFLTYESIFDASFHKKYLFVHSYNPNDYFSKFNARLTVYNKKTMNLIALLDFKRKINAFCLFENNYCYSNSRTITILSINKFVEKKSILIKDDITYWSLCANYQFIFGLNDRNKIDIYDWNLKLVKSIGQSNDSTGAFYFKDTVLQINIKDDFLIIRQSNSIRIIDKNSGKLVKKVENIQKCYRFVIDDNYNQIVAFTDCAIYRIYFKGQHIEKSEFNFIKEFRFKIMSYLSIKNYILLSNDNKKLYST
jgi:hypothetical protein